MCSANPAYENNLKLFRTWIDATRMPEAPVICDVGAGTGNYSLELARRFPNSRVIHLDSDPMMNRTASQKYRSAGAENVEFKASTAEDAQLDPDSLDLIVCVNALYTLPGTETVLQKFWSWLKPSALLFLIDLGRPMDVTDWSQYIVRSSLKERGVGATVKSFIKGRKAIGQNRLIRREQDHGRYWLHSPEEFRSTISAAGFEILDLQTCYRGACDLAVGRKIG
jgi:ubiquinone/menaquinone biosynthesis C-methylase UbiE